MKETILVVEDGEAVRNLVCRMLVENGYRVLEARGGRDAVRLCETHPGGVDLVLTDLVMPQMSGDDLAERLRRTNPRLRILVMSGYSDEPTMHRLQRCALSFIPKPFTSVQLADKIREVLDAPSKGLGAGGF